MAIELYTQDQLPVKRVTRALGNGGGELIPASTTLKVGVLAYKLSADGDCELQFEAGGQPLSEPHFIAARGTIIAGRNENLWYIVSAGKALGCDIVGDANVAIYVQYIELPA